LEHNEVLVLLGAAFAADVPIVALHLTRPPWALERFAADRPLRLQRLRERLDDA
jgi:hypothetical protein